MSDAGPREYGLWPLHPQPCKYETLTMWVERLAAAYGVPYPFFCRHAFGLSFPGLLWVCSEPTEEFLEKLAAGTGVSTCRLRQMTIGSLMAQFERELDFDLQRDDRLFAAWLEERSRKSAQGYRSDPEYWRVIAVWEKKKAEKVKPEL